MANTDPTGGNTYLGLVPKQPPNLDLFLAALRWQESGSPQGNYQEPNGQGAYQIIQSNWPTWVKTTGLAPVNDANASDAPPQTQDLVAASKVAAYYWGPAHRNWRLVGRLWNGGSTTPVPNRALGPGATSDTYATQLLAKMAQLQREGYNPKTLTALAPATLHDLTTSAENACHHSLKIPIRLAPDIHLCMDKPIALLAMGAGGLLMLAGTAVIVVTLARNTAAGRAAQGALTAAVPVARVARGAGAAAAAQRPSQRRARQGERDAAEVAERHREARQAGRDRAAISRRMTGAGIDVDTLEPRRTTRRPTPPRPRPAPRRPTRPARPGYAPTGRRYRPGNDPAPF